MTLYDFFTGENLGAPTDEQEGEPIGVSFLIINNPTSTLHGRVVDADAMPAGYFGARRVIVFDRDAYLAPFNGRNVWHTVSI